MTCPVRWFLFRRKTDYLDIGYFALYCVQLCILNSYGPRKFQGCQKGLREGFVTESVWHNTMWYLYIVTVIVTKIYHIWIIILGILLKIINTNHVQSLPSNHNREWMNGYFVDSSLVLLHSSATSAKVYGAKHSIQTWKKPKISKNLKASEFWIRFKLWINQIKAFE